MNQKKTPSFKYKKLTGNIIAAAMNVHSELGNGFREIVYHRSMIHELTSKGLNFESELTMPLYYRDANVGARRVNLLVEGKILVELKAVGELNDQHISQVLNYLKAYKLEVALLLNFGENSLTFRRIAQLKNYK
ncbi:MAG: GxxExxY protein [Balneolaceae bacterium]